MYKELRSAEQQTKIELMKFQKFQIAQILEHSLQRLFEKQFN